MRLSLQFIHWEGKSFFTARINQTYNLPSEKPQTTKTTKETCKDGKLYIKKKTTQNPSNKSEKAVWYSYTWMPTLTWLVAPPKSPRKRLYRILLERRPHLSLVSAPNSWRSQRTEEQCTWSSFPAHHTSSTVCGEKGQCHHFTPCLLSYSSKKDAVSK